MILGQLTDLLMQIRKEDHSKASSTLGGVTIGGHLQHTPELFICFEIGCYRGPISYDVPAHDASIESDKRMRLEVSLNPTCDISHCVNTNTMRKLVYNMQYTVHNTAVIRIDLAEVAPYISLNSDFGLGSTVRYHRMTYEPEKSQVLK